MAITRRPPNTIILSGGGPGAEQGIRYVNDYVAGATIRPGMLIEKYNDAGVTKWRPHSATADMRTVAVAVEQLMLNKGVDDDYAAGDLVQAAYLGSGCIFWGIGLSGQTIGNQTALQSDGTGKLKAATATTAAANVAWFKSNDALGAIVADTRCRVEVM